MTSSLFQFHLETIETHINSVAQLLQSSASSDLTPACAALQSAVLALSSLTQQKSAKLDADPSLKARLRKASLSLASCRESLARRAALTQGALGALMPATRQDTYAPAANQYARQLYGSAGRQSGEFRATSA
ncbi:hypothetical protein [Rhodoferax sp.]|uniref:hypothetical protein n=1 Tax=Rhodoferax sp. TaxID=50421 RepID=UPI002847EF54|nr:hypothetical protein [Rhodoferax sp.]MDR3371374.1 hypothetical protein [Rhodoferax sp.]